MKKVISVFILSTVFAVNSMFAIPNWVIGDICGGILGGMTGASFGPIGVGVGAAAGAVNGSMAITSYPNNRPILVLSKANPDNPMDYVGIRHNQVLYDCMLQGGNRNSYSLIISSLAKREPNKPEAINEKFLVEISKEWSNYDENNIESLAKVTDKFTDKTIAAKIKDLIITGSKIEKVEDFEAMVLKTEAEILKYKDSLDKQVALASLSIMRNSAIFWANNKR